MSIQKELVLGKFHQIPYRLHQIQHKKVRNKKSNVVDDLFNLKVLFS